MNYMILAAFGAARSTVWRVGLLAACAWTNAYAQTTPGPGCVVGAASPAIGADVPETYFGPTPSTVQKELVGPLQLLTAGVLDRRAATITLPPPRFSEARLDVDRSRVVDHDRGILNDIGSVVGGGGGSDRELYQLGKQKLDVAARSDSGLLARARENTTSMLEGLLSSLGFRHVTVRFEAEAAL